MEINPIDPAIKEQIKTAIEEGGSNRGIAKDFGVSSNTVKRLREKMGVPNEHAQVSAEPTFQGAPSRAAETPITEPPQELPQIDSASAGLICAIAANALATFLGPGWAITPAQQKELGEAGAEWFNTSGAVPPSVAKYVIKNQASLKFGSVLLKVYGPKIWQVILQYMAQREGMPMPKEVATQHEAFAGSSFVPPPPPSPSSGTASSNAPGEVPNLPETENIIDPQTNTVITVPRKPMHLVRSHRNGVFDNLR